MEKDRERPLEKRERIFRETAAHLPDFIREQVLTQRYNELHGMLASIEGLAINIGLIGFWKQKRLLEDPQTKDRLGEVRYTARLNEAGEQIYVARRIFQTLGLNDSLLYGIFSESATLHSEVNKLLETKTPLTHVPEL